MLVNGRLIPVRQHWRPGIRHAYKTTAVYKSDIDR